jgi:alpha-beta hydrolase superfamily lysophospholipase
MRRAAAVTLVLVLAAGCTDAAEKATTTLARSTMTTLLSTTTSASTTTGTSTSTTRAASAVEVVEDLVYHPGSERLEEALLDVCAPPGVEGIPVVVLFHGGGASRHDYRELATAIAERGAVVFVPDWQGGEPFIGSTRDDLLDYVDGSACAVSYALAHAAEYGADPERLVLFGHSAGAMVASVVALREATPLPECVVEVSPFQADGMVLWEGDWLLIHAGWDQQGGTLPSVMEVITPWAWLASGPEMSVDLITTAARANRCGMTDPSDPYWLRDPDGWFWERLEALGALADGCIDVGEPTELLADTMREQGFDVVELFLEESTHTYLSRHDQALVVAEVIAIADR